MEEIINPMDDVLSQVVNDGLHYAMDDYSEWKEVEDKKFHELREAYLKVANELTDYIGENSSSS